jgi:Rrf2 family protein
MTERRPTEARRIMLSQTSEYALRAVLHLAREGSDGPLRVGDVAQALGAPGNYLSKILHTLVKARVLSSRRGPTGGFELARRPTEIALVDVIGPFDPFEERASCLLRGAPCDEHDPCPAHGRWREVSESVRRFFHETTIAELAGLGLAESGSVERGGFDDVQS